MFGVKRYPNVVSSWLCVHSLRGFTSAKILSQLKNANTSIPIEFYVQAKAKDPPTDAVPRFFQAYAAHDRVGTLTKEPHSGKLVDEWTKMVADAEKKPTLTDMSPAIASLLAVKDEDELVCYFPCLSMRLIQPLVRRNAFGVQQTSRPPSSHITSHPNSRLSSTGRRRYPTRPSLPRSRHVWDTAKATKPRVQT